MAILFKDLFAAARTTLSEEYKETYQKEFLEGLLAYRHPVIFDPVEKCCCTHGIRDGSVSETEYELTTHAPYAALVNDARQRERITGTINPPLLSILIAEGYVCPRSQKVRKSMVIPRNVKAELIKLGIWKEDSANNSRQAPSSRASLDEEASRSANDIPNNHRGGVTRNSANNPRNVVYNVDSDSDDFLDSQQFATQQPSR